MPSHPSLAAERLFAELIDLDPAQQAARLDAGCAGEPALRAEVESLLEAARRGADYLDGLRLRLGLPADAETGREAANVGPWRLIRELGSGGMGRVWLADRTDLLQGRQVALKLPHLSGSAWRRSGLAERLAREREILATLEHPHIARLYDAGITPAGQPGWRWSTWRVSASTASAARAPCRWPSG
jgi:eukaryotic-like serine/threonine-protein kinase